jgi:hypothetical protein
MAELITPQELPRWVPGDITLERASPLGGCAAAGLSLCPFGCASPGDAGIFVGHKSGRLARLMSGCPRRTDIAGGR